jgi:N-methylhydantoinase A
MTCALVTRSRTNVEKPHGRTARTSHTLIVGVDTGGTFTDIVYRDGARTGAYKLPSTPDDPARAVIRGLEVVFGERTAERLTYGTTVATNAMLERRGVKTALVTTAGFEDVLEIGRQARPFLYDLEPVRPEPLVPSRLRFGAVERMLYDGTVEQPLTARAASALAARIRRSGVRSIAVCLLHAPANPAHEKRVATAFARLGLPVTLSHELCPAAGEYERTATTVANSYVRPIVATHLERLAREVRSRTLRVMQSNGGAIGVAVAAREPVRTMLSGPAGGVAAAATRARAARLERIISLDMGGTSTDVAFIDGTVPHRTETSIGDVPLLVPSIDIHTVGAGGGSIASVDVGGALKVGPESAGAEPGPACYGRGTQPTVTDANVVLGRLRPESFLGGTMALDAKRSRAALAGVATAMGAYSAEQAAEGVVRVVEGTMERAIRVITVERGQDPRSCALFVFGGAAGLHACGLADALAIPEVVVPRDPGVLSAWGVLDGPVLRDVVHPLARVDASYDEVARAAGRASAAARRELVRDGIPARRITVRAWARVRYLGQSIELEVPLARDFRRAFDRMHMRLLHTASPDRSIEVTAIKASAIADLGGRAPAPRRVRSSSKVAAKPRARVAVWLDGRTRAAPLYERASLSPGARLKGPAILTEYSSTLLVARAWTLSVDREGNLRLRRSDRRG